MNRGAAVVALVTLSLGLALFRWGSGPLRGTGGDVGVIVFLVASLAALNLGSSRSRLIAVGAFAVAAELTQGLGLVPRDAHWIWHLTLGATFDWWDFVAYAVGLVLAAGLERGLARRARRHPSR